MTTGAAARRAEHGAPRTLPRAAPLDQGVDPAGIDAFRTAVERTGLGLHSLMVVVHGAVVAEGWWAPYAAELPHQLLSLSASVTATAVGFAEAESLLCLDDPVLQWLGDRAPSDPSPYLRSLRIEHLLTMTAGHDVDPSGTVVGAQDWVRAFLSVPMDHEPGTHFANSAAASDALAAIVELACGEPVLDYLRPRLLDPLGIVGATVDPCRCGVGFGGFGLTLRTEDVACLAQLYLDDGVWDDRRVLPERWVERATARRVPNGVGDSDWTQGFGYQFWRSRHGAYRADGAFGQLALVLPEQDAVVVTTAGESNVAGLLDLIWAHLLPAFGAGVPPERPAPSARLRTTSSREPGESTDAMAERLADLHVPWPQGAPVTRAVSVQLEPNRYGVARVRVEPHLSGARVLLDGDLTADLIAGHHAWVSGRVPWTVGADVVEPDGEPAALAAAWTGPDTLELLLCWLHGPFVLRVVAQVSPDAAPQAPVRVTADLNVAFGPTRLAELRGTVQR